VTEGRLLCCLLTSRSSPRIMQNPQVNGTMPVPMDNELFVLSRGGIAFSAKSGSTKVEDSGVIHLSTLRMVFVSDSGSKHFDIPLATLEDEKFNQPIFGANNMTGANSPLDLADGAPHYKWCISFRNGGVGTFLPFFFRLLQEMRQRMQQPAVPIAQPITGAAQQGVPIAVAQSMVQSAFVDPNDPTKFYVPQ